MKNIFKNLFSNNKNKEEDLFKKNYEDNNLVNKKQKVQVLRNQDEEYDNLEMLKDLSLSEKNYLERELDFKYDCTDYKILDVIRTDSTCFEVYCEINVYGDKKLITEKILYTDIKDKKEEL